MLNQMLIFFTADFGVARVLDRASIAKSFCGEFILPFSAVSLIPRPSLEPGNEANCSYFMQQ